MQLVLDTASKVHLEAKGDYEDSAQTSLVVTQCHFVSCLLLTTIKKFIHNSYFGIIKKSISTATIYPLSDALRS